MQFIRFLAASLILSFPIFLRILPIYFITVFLVGAVFLASIKYFLVFKVFIFVAWMPILVFMAMNAVRAGLVHRRESRGPDLTLMIRKTLHWAGVFWVISLVFGVFSYAAVALLGTPENMEKAVGVSQDLMVIITPEEEPKPVPELELEPEISTDDPLEPRVPLLPGGIFPKINPNADQSDTPDTMAEPADPAIIGPAAPTQMPPVAIPPTIPPAAPPENNPAVVEETQAPFASNGLQVAALVLIQLAYLAVLSGLAVPFVAAAASIGIKGPNHDFFYGAGRRIKSILGISVAVSILQTLIIAIIAKASGTAMFMAALGIFSTELAVIPIAGIIGLVLVLALLIYSSCISAASAVIAYIEARSQIAEEKEAELSQNVTFEAEPAHDIGAMMRERSERSRMNVAPAAAPVAASGNETGDRAGTDVRLRDAHPKPAAPASNQPYDPYAKRVAADETAHDASEVGEAPAEPTPSAPSDAPQAKTADQPAPPETPTSHAELAAGFRRTRRLPPTAAEAVEEEADDGKDPDWLKDLMADDEPPEPDGKKS